MNHLLDTYRLWLKQKNYSPATIRNYIADAKKYLQNQNIDSNFSHIFSTEPLTQYLSKLNADLNYRRYLASLRVFCQFALDQNYITQDPLKHFSLTQAPPDQNTIQDQFKDYLLAQHFSSSTIKNYLNDIQNYLFWLEHNQHVS